MMGRVKTTGISKNTGKTQAWQTSEQQKPLRGKLAREIQGRISGAFFQSRPRDGRKSARGMVHMQAQIYN